MKQEVWWSREYLGILGYWVRLYPKFFTPHFIAHYVRLWVRIYELHHLTLVYILQNIINNLYFLRLLMPPAPSGPPPFLSLAACS